MQRFELATPATVKVVRFQTRSEHHGEALVTAMDLRVQWETKASVLQMLHPELYEMLTSVLPDGHSTQGELALASEGRNFIRFKDMKYPLQWTREYTGWTLRVDYGLGEEGGSGFSVPLCKVHKFDITPKDNEIVILEFTISSSADLTEEFVGHMGMQQQKNVVISLLAPNKTDGDAPIDASNGSGAPGADPAPGSKNNTDATQAFIAAHTGSDGKPAAGEGVTTH